MNPIAPLQVPCKCCGAASELFGVVDFHKNCDVPGRKALPVSGIPIYYHRCSNCQFIFSIAFDHFSPADFSKWIYNDQYAQTDPEYAQARPAQNAKTVEHLFRANPSIKILDYGGGNGSTSQILRGLGFTNVQTYDPFVPESSTRPQGKFDCVVCFEVLEHTPNPRETIAELTSFAAGPGVVIFSTLLQPENINELGINWWYILPRNGHISIYSRRSLDILLNSLGFNFASFNEGTHAMCRQPAPPVTHAVP